MLDSSYALELVLPTHASWQADTVRLFDRATSDLEVVVPMIFLAEVAAVLTRKVRGRATTHDKAETFLAELQQVPLGLDVTLLPAGQLYDLAGQWHCGAYDAIYIEVAQRMGLPLATRDRGQVAGARLAGVEAFAFV